MNSTQTSGSIEDACISCKRSLSAQLALYQCRCCSIQICPDCVCAAKVSTTSLIRVSDARFASRTVSDAVPHPVAASELQAVPNDVPAQSNRTVKRKPLRARDTSFAQGSNQPSQSAPISVAREQDQATRQLASPVQSPPETVLSQNEEVSSVATKTTWITQNPAAAASVQSPMQPADSERRRQMSSANSTNESAAVVSTPRPPLRHAQTVPVPQPTLQEADSAQLRRFSTSQPHPSASAPNAFDKRKSVSQVWSSSLETGKKLAGNKFVKAGAKYAANLAVRAVVKEVIGDVFNNDFGSSNDSGQTSGQTSGDGGGGMMDLLLNDNGNGMTSSPADLQMSQVDVNGLFNPDMATPVQPGFDTVRTTEPTTDLFQQQQAAAIGLSMALQEQSLAAQAAIQESQQSQWDMQYQASQTLDWGTDAAVPGIMANSYSGNTASNDGFDADDY